MACPVGATFHAVATGVGWEDLVEGVVGVAPHVGVPRIVDFVDVVVVLGFKPFAEGLCAAIAPAEAAVFVGKVPGDDR